MRHFIGAITPFLFIHFICCGALLFFLVSSGYLLLLSLEGSNKFFLIPSLLLTLLLFWLNYRHRRGCQLKGHKTFKDCFIGLTLYLLISLTAGFIFIIYIFLPWWIPGYQGGMLLP